MVCLTGQGGAHPNARRPIPPSPPVRLLQQPTPALPSCCSASHAHVSCPNFGYAWEAPCLTAALLGCWFSRPRGQPLAERKNCQRIQVRLIRKHVVKNITPSLQGKCCCVRSDGVSACKRNRCNSGPKLHPLSHDLRAKCFSSGSGPSEGHQDRHHQRRADR